MSGIPVSVPVQGLSPATKYYYRVVVEGVPSTEETTFTTQPEGGEFMANGLLGDASEREAEKGNCNDIPHLEDKVGTACDLYVEHFDGSGWEAPVFIATLSGEDSPSYEEYGGLPDLTARVSPNGRWLAFMSDRRLTGYDNLDVASGVPDEGGVRLRSGDGWFGVRVV